MKRKLVLGLVAFTGGLAVVGSGFASWYFAQTTDNKSITVGTYTTDMNKGIGELETIATVGETTEKIGDNKICLVLDQGRYANASNALCGVSFHKLGNDATASDTAFSSSTLVSTLGVRYTISSENLTTLQNAGVTKGTLTTTITLKTDYLAFNSYTADEFIGGTSTTAGTATAGEKTLVFTTTIDLSTATVEAAATSYSTDVTFDVSTSNYGTSSVNKMLKYGDSKKPENSESYSAMTSAMSALTNSEALNVTYSFTVGTTETAYSAA